MKFSCKNILRIAGLGVLAALAVYIGGGEILTQRRRDAEYAAKGRLTKIEETGKPTEYRHCNNLSECTNATLVGQAPRACRVLQMRRPENDDGQLSPGIDNFAQGFSKEMPDAIVSGNRKYAIGNFGLFGKLSALGFKRRYKNGKVSK